MSTTRLAFLYPHLFRAVRLGESTAAVQPTKTRHRSQPCRSSPYASSFSTSARARQAPFERHGTAVEPQLVTPSVITPPPPEKRITSRLPDPSPDDTKKAAAENASSKESHETEIPSNDEVKETLSDGKGSLGSKESKESKDATSSTPQQAAVEETMRHGGPMEAVLHMPSPESLHHPHIPTPQYVHHFDSYSLVKQLEDSGYSRDQSITVMKAVRSLLAQNLDVAQEGLVSKRDVDNETYLFRAACEELSTEVTNSRRAADEQSRQQRTQLQHEVDILGQRMTQDIMTLKDSVKALFNDRRMTVRDEQRNMESAIQQVNLKISVILNSDSRSDIEGLRWILIRRSVTGILVMVILTLSIMRYATYVSHERKREAEEKAREAKELKRNGYRDDRAPPVDAAEILAAN